MYNYRFIQSLSLLNECEKAVLELQKNGFGGKSLDNAAKWFISSILEENKSTIEKSKFCDESHLVKIGEYHRESILSISEFPEAIEIGIDTADDCKLAVIYDPSERKIASEFFQGIISSFLSDDEEKNDNWLFISPEDGGAAFGIFSKLFKTGRQRFGFKIYSDDSEISKQLSMIEKTVQENISKSGGKNVYSEKSEGIKKYNIAISDLSLLSGIVSSQIHKLMKQSAYGINFIVLDKSKKILTDYEFLLGIGIDKNSGVFYAFDNEIKFMPSNNYIFKDIDIEKLLEEKKISTLYSDNFGNQLNPFDMYSKDHIKIPFALENGKICDFIIGGDAQPHALISGQTGSGKSVTLHTLIDMVLLHYHPDDVEIWAIDYKMVEFGGYAKKRTPHIRVIGQDNSVEFSLSLIDLAYEEYESRKKLFDSVGVKNIEQYREMCGNLSIPRILIVIDEFHNLVQSIQNHIDSSYKTKLENLLKETRAMGISFIFSSQFVSSGLSGLTESGRAQIGIRLCMKQIKSSEVTETLAVKSTDYEIINEVLEFGKGQCMYKTGYGGADSIKNVRILYVDDDLRDRIIDTVNEALKGQSITKNEIICKSKERYGISEKRNHCLNRFIESPELLTAENELKIFPAAPASLKTEYCLKLTDNASNNLMIVGNDDGMRESMALMSVCSLLMYSDVVVKFNFLDDENTKSQSLYCLMSKIKADNFVVYKGFKAVSENIKTLDTLRKNNKTVVNCWYGLNKLKSESFANSNNDDDEISVDVSDDILDLSSIDFLDSVLKSVQKKRINESPVQHKKITSNKEYTFDDYSKILKNLFEYGPDNRYYNIVIYSGPKNFSKDPFIRLTDFDFRIGTRMSLDDSYLLFGTQGFAGSADENTAVCYTGSREPSLIRPYLVEDNWINSFNESLKGKADINRI